MLYKAKADVNPDLTFLNGFKGTWHKFKISVVHVYFYMLHSDIQSVHTSQQWAHPNPPIILLSSALASKKKQINHLNRLLYLIIYP